MFAKTVRAAMSGRPSRARSTAAAVALLAALWAATPAFGQGPNEIVVALPPTDSIYVAAGYYVMDDLSNAVTAAMLASNAAYTAYAAYSHYTIWVDDNGGTPWMDNLDVFADVPMTIRGASGPGSVANAPNTVIVQSADPNQAVVEVLPALVSGSAVNGLLLESLTLTGGAYGIYTKGGASVTANRCYVRDNGDSGVYLKDGSSALLVNCSLSLNGNDGVSVEDNSFADILYCSIIQNVRAGVYIYSDVGGDARLANSLVFENRTYGIAASVPAVPVLAKNDVFMNPDAVLTNNYFNVAPGGTDIAADPILWQDVWTEPTPWMGALAASLCTYEAYTTYRSPLMDAAVATFAALPYSAEDFYQDVRPDAISSLPDIGADEVACGFSIVLPGWYHCLIRPNPIGVRPAGSVEIEIGVTPEVIPDEVFMVPEGGDPLNVFHRIPFQYNSTAGVLQIFTNQVPITRDAIGLASTPNRDNALDAGELLADGHAVVYIRVAEVIFGIDDAGVITGSAITGRHAIIDTTPPRMVAAAAPGGWLAGNDPPGVGLVDFLNAWPGYSYTTADAALTGFHPTYPAAGRQATMAAPYDDGVISQDVFVGSGAQILFNPGSLSNMMPQEGLQIAVTVPFEDPWPLDAAGVEQVRVRAGFDPSGTQVTTGPSNTIAQWYFDTGSALFAAVEAECVYTTSGTNIGFDPVMPSSLTYDYNNANTEGRWTFGPVDALSGLRTGLPWDRAPAHASIRFRAVDRAGNATEIEKMLEPLQLWWLIQARTRISPNHEGQTVASPTFNFRLDRVLAPQNLDVPLPADPPDPTELAPQFAYRFYASPTINGPYAPVTGWVWTFDNAISLQDPLVLPPAQLSALSGQWVLLVVLGADEAGNVEPWPYQDLVGNVETPQVAQGRTSGLNWQRFRLGLGGFDTAIDPTFWHDIRPPNGSQDLNETSFGSQTIIPSPTDLLAEQVAAGFRITLMNASGILANSKVVWSLVRGDGTVAALGVGVQTSPGTVQVVLPTVNGLMPRGSTSYDPDERLEGHVDPTNLNVPRQPQYWTFRAQAFDDKDNNDAWDAGEDGDETPASVAFTVVPEATIESYMRNRESLDRQPVKVQEEQ